MNQGLVLIPIVLFILTKGINGSDHDFDDLF